MIRTLCDYKFRFAGMGLFKTENTWIHPQRTEATYEIILVTEGTVHIEENNIQRTLGKGELFILTPHISHRGFAPSHGRTAFYWVHFFTDSPLPENFPLYCAHYSETHLFKELLHYANLPNCPETAVHAILLHILTLQSLQQNPLPDSRLANDVFEWIRISADAALTAEKTAAYFGYNSEYLSRLIRQQYGCGIKSLIDRMILNRITTLLSNTNDSVKEISAQLCFPSVSACINFFKYHQSLSPTQYRNLYVRTHMNKK